MLIYVLWSLNFQISDNYFVPKAAITRRSPVSQFSGLILKMSVRVLQSSRELDGRYTGVEYALAGIL